MNLIKIVEWSNQNNGFIMALLTFVYVVATILICIFNYKSAKATKEQTNEAYKQFIENSRAHVIPKIIEIEGTMICLSFQNIGKDIASDVVINVNEKWLKILEKTHTFPEVAESLRKIRKKKIFLTVDQSISYGICIPGNGYDDFVKLGEKDIVITISYTTLNKQYVEKFVIPLSGYNYLLNRSDYVRLTKKQIEEQKNTNKELKNINNTLKNIKN